VRLARRHPRAELILGHAGIGNFDLHAVELLQPEANLSFETSGGFSWVAKHAVEKLGAERVLFGSEYPLQDPFLELEKLKRLGLGPSELTLVLGGNIRRLLGEVA
jgi:predicted TIM-barrel fold metal-dependent hydrolase